MDLIRRWAISVFKYGTNYLYVSGNLLQPACDRKPPMNFKLFPQYLEKLNLFA
jgi:hypothetical protein